MLSLDFHFAGRVLRVEGTEEPLCWLHEFVTPQLAACPSPRPDETIRFILDAGEHARLSAAGAHPEGLTRPCYTLDSGIVSGRLWHGADDAEVVFEETLGVFFRRTPGEGNVVEVIAAGDTGEARVAVMRVLREYAMLYAARAGWLIVHAAAVRLGRDALVIAGPKRAGKTSVLLHVLRRERGAYIANDRVALSSQDHTVTVHGLPTIVSIRKESGAWFPDLDAQIAGLRYDSRLDRPRPDAGRDGPRATMSAVWSVSPRQLCHALGVEATTSVRVAGFLFPGIDAGPGEPVLEELSAEAALVALHGALCPPYGGHGMFRIPRTAPSTPEPSMEAGAAGVASRVPGFRCRLGPDAYRDGAGWLSNLSRRLADRSDWMASRPPAHQS